MRLRLACPLILVGVLFSVTAFAEDSTERAKLDGSWRVQGASGAAASAVWILDTKGDLLRLTNSQGDKKIAEFICGLGKECEVKDAGRKVRVTLYFNGPKLVVMETRGDEIFKRRFGAGEQADTLDLEMIPVTPAGKTETLHFKRVEATSAAASH